MRLQPMQNSSTWGWGIVLPWLSHQRIPVQPTSCHQILFHDQGNAFGGTECHATCTLQKFCPPSRINWPSSYFKFTSAGIYASIILKESSVDIVWCAKMAAPYCQIKCLAGIQWRVEIFNYCHVHMNSTSAYNDPRTIPVFTLDDEYWGLLRHLPQSSHLCISGKVKLPPCHLATGHVVWQSTCQGVTKLQ